MFVLHRAYKLIDNLNTKLYGKHFILNILFLMMFTTVLWGMNYYPILYLRTLKQRRPGSCQREHIFEEAGLGF